MMTPKMKCLITFLQHYTAFIQQLLTAIFFDKSFKGNKLFLFLRRTNDFVAASKASVRWAVLWIHDKSRLKLIKKAGMVINNMTSLQEWFIVMHSYLV